MIEQAELSGKLKPGATIVEATAGSNTACAVLVAGAKGYKLHLVIPDKMAGKLVHLMSSGAKITITRSDVGKGHPQYYQDVAQRIADETLAHSTLINSTTPPIHSRTKRPLAPKSGNRPISNVDAIVCGVGSGGTLAGLATISKSRGRN